MSDGEKKGRGGKICGAKTRAGGVCQVRAMPNGRCRIHGGMSLKGAESGTFKHGRTSKYFVDSLPKGMREKFEEVYNDQDLLSLRNFVTVYELRVIEAMDRYAKLDSAGFRENLQDRWEAFKQVNAMAAETDEDRQAKRDKVTAILQEIDKLVATGAAEREAWLEVHEAMECRRAATAQEQRRLVDLGQMITIEQAMAIVVVMHDILHARIKDPGMLSMIARDLEIRLGLTAAMGPGKIVDEGK